ncbi:MAG: Ig-like domain-containing protein [Gammaproteobacteria bacterium]|nr:Ig-like domain-containing protein [Gammaproteobacteria bacterium]
MTQQNMPEHCPRWASGGLAAAVAKTLKRSFLAGLLMLLSSYVFAAADPGNSSVAVANSPAKEDGVDAVTLTATIKDGSGVAVSGEVVTFAATSNVDLGAGIGSSNTCTTDTNGVCSVAATTTFEASYSTAVSVSAGTLSNSPASYSFTEALTAGSPRAINDTYDVVEDSTPVLCIIDNDTDGSELTGVVADSPIHIPSTKITNFDPPLAGGTLVDDSGCNRTTTGSISRHNAIQLSLDSNATGTDTFYYGIDSGSVVFDQDNCAVSTNDMNSCGHVTVNVKQVAVTSDATATTPENVATSTAVYTATGGDGDGDSVTFSLVGATDDALFSIDPSTGDVTFDTSPDFREPQRRGRQQRVRDYRRSFQ